MPAPVALKWLTFNADNKLEADATARGYFTSPTVAKTRTFLVSIIGPARKGKSALMCELQKRAASSQGIAYTSASFTVGASATPITKGVDISPVGFGPTKDSLLLLADTEGQGDQSADVDTRVFVPVMLTSNVLLYNTTTAGGASKSHILTELRGFVAATRRVNSHRTGGGAAAASSSAGAASVPSAVAASEPAAFGHLHIVVRDYALDNWDPAWHYDTIFTANDKTTAEERATQDAVKAAFASITVHLLPHYRLPFEAEGRVIGVPVTFKEGIDRLWEQVWQQTCSAEKARTTMAATLSGARLAALTGELVPVLNTDGVVIVSHVYHSIIRAECLELVQAITNQVHNLHWNDEATRLATTAATTAAGDATLLSVLLQRLESENLLLDPIFERIDPMQPQAAVYEEVEAAYTAAVKHAAAALLGALRTQLEASVYAVTNVASSTIAAECSEAVAAGGRDVATQLSNAKARVQADWQANVEALRGFAAAMAPSDAIVTDDDTTTEACAKQALKKLMATEAPLLSEATVAACTRFWSDAVTSAIDAALTRTAAAASKLLLAEAAAAAARLDADSRAALPGVSTGAQTYEAMDKLQATADAITADLRARGDQLGATAADVAAAVEVFGARAEATIHSFLGVCGRQVQTATALAEARAAKEEAERAAAEAYQQIRDMTERITAADSRRADGPMDAYDDGYLDAYRPLDFDSADTPVEPERAFRPPPPPISPPRGATIADYRAKKAKVGSTARVAHVGTGAAASPVHIKRDGTLDMRYSDSKAAVAAGLAEAGVPYGDRLPAGAAASTPVRVGDATIHVRLSDGKPDKRFADTKAALKAGIVDSDVVYGSGGAATYAAPVTPAKAAAAPAAAAYTTPPPARVTPVVAVSGGAGTVHLKKDGTPDMRYADSKAAVAAGYAARDAVYSSGGSASYAASARYAPSPAETHVPVAAYTPPARVAAVTPTTSIHLKKDGTPDMRYSDSKAAVASGAASRGTVYSSGGAASYASPSYYSSPAPAYHASPAPAYYASPAPAASRSSYGSGGGSSYGRSPSGPLKKDGTPDMRYKSNW